LILWRHAHAKARETSTDDAMRELTRHGHRQAHRMAVWLDHRMAGHARILVSPALRAEQTAVALGRPYELCDALRPEATAQEVLDAIGWQPGAAWCNKEPLLLVGHQPWLGEVGSRLLGDRDGGLSFKKAGVWWLRERRRRGSSEWDVAATMSPRSLESDP
jgi:phosphohistidine phosphatase